MIEQFELAPGAVGRRPFYHHPFLYHLTPLALNPKNRVRRKYVRLVLRTFVDFTLGLNTSSLKCTSNLKKRASMSSLYPMGCEPSYQPDETGL